MNSQNTTGRDLAWVAAKFVEDTAGVRYAVVLSSDGLPLAEGGEPPDSDADRLAAAASGIYSLAVGVSRVFELAAYQHSFLRFTGGDVVITAMASDAAMAVVTKPGAQLSTVAHEMALFAKRVGENFDLAPRKVVRS